MIWSLVRLLVGLLLLWLAVDWLGAAAVALALALLAVVLLDLLIRSRNDQAAELQRIRQQLDLSDRNSAAWSDRALDRIEALEERSERQSRRLEALEPRSMQDDD